MRVNAGWKKECLRNVDEAAETVSEEMKEWAQTKKIFRKAYP